MSSWFSVTAHHLRFAALSYFRNPSAAFFGIGFPVILLLFNGMFFGKMQPGDGILKFYVASMSAFAIISVCFTGLAITLAFDRDQGRLKRQRSTPTPISAYVAARILFSIIVGLATVLVCLLIGGLVFGVVPDAISLILFFGVIVLGAACFSALGLAVVNMVPNAQAAPAILNAISFPLLFASNIFFPVQNSPGWLVAITGALPFRPLGQLAVGALTGGDVRLLDAQILLAWTAGAAILAILFFRWRPAR
ncbi:ABC transporter permease [Parvularcula sp. LCG005]|uniref:ABC transporter permease n=1 Tax=Parvularcula sp. LCG005 TaxID=3078805 RepID=UPI002941E809|nr:ABC transporter permease [Parvularcula sp. LCG005]WOI52263.1 ABC transporter permease [Parvularcula sp. LCG005]